MIHVVATITLHPGTRSAFLEEFRRLMPLVQVEEGCVEYQGTVEVATTIPVQDPPRPDVVMVIEQWTSLDALHEHLQATHMIEYRDKVKDYVRGVDLQVLEPI
jgi:quinol monooxygenase YgiN